MSPQLWASIGVLLVGSLTQFAIFSFFIGKMKGAQEAINLQVSQLTSEMTAFRAAIGAADVARAGDAVRLSDISTNAAKIERFRDEFTGFMGAYREERRHLTSLVDKHSADIERLQRGQATLASGRGVKPMDLGG